ncbi:hypothetical protein HYV80_03030 [Candidatus Woesearchaeota archaeon]|nr:hypothetical protein [Candidatus Woesearchaeota archaeon]
MKAAKIWLVAALLAFVIGCSDGQNDKTAEELVYKHAKAWETGDVGILSEILHEDVIFAYPGRRLDKL